VIAVLALVGLMRALLVRLIFLSTRFDVARLSAGVGAALSLLYADFSGGSGSAWRAAFMLCVVLGARSLGFRVGGAGALGASLLIGICVDPLAGSDFSFLLSALATAGLIGIGQPLSRLLDGTILGRPYLRPVSLSFIATVSSTVVCAPVLALMDGSMTLAALFANVIAGPLGELIALPACLLHSVVPAETSLEQGLATLGSGALLAVREVALWSASIKEAQFEVPFPTSYNLCWGISFSLLFFSLRHWKSRVALGLAGIFFAGSPGTLDSKETALAAQGQLATAEGKAATQSEAAQLAAAAATAPAAETNADEAPEPGIFTVTALDVGQGDALFLDFPDGKVGLMDGGGFATGFPDTGERVLLPYLRSRSIKSLDLVILSHAHPDHMNGLLSLADSIPFKEFWAPGPGVKKTHSLALLIKKVRAKGGRVIFSDTLCAREQGKTAFPFGGVLVEALSPCHVSTPPLSANDASLVLRFSHGSTRALLTGDIEKATESHLVATQASRLSADLLKVGHHGSHTSSTPAFIQAVSPQVAFISSGVRNRFDHPRAETLETLNSAKVKVFRSDDSGSLSWRSDGVKTEIRSFSTRLRSTDPSNVF
jgi:competence protein ComEC